MDSSQLKEQAHRILDTRWLPGKDQEQIRTGIQDLERIIAQLHEQHDPAAQTLLLRTQQLYDRAERQYYSDLPPVVKNGLSDLMGRVEDMLAKHTGSDPRREHTRYLLRNSGLEAQKSLRSLRTDIKHFRHIPYSYLEAERAQDNEVVAALRAHDLPVVPEKRYSVHPLHNLHAQDNLELICAPQAWEYASGAGVHVGVIDSGCDHAHAELRERFTNEPGYDFVNDTPDPVDENGHGTHVAGTVAGKLVGVAPQATLYALKFLDEWGRGSQTDFIRAAEWAIDHKLDILNGSFGSADSNEAEKAICDKLAQEGILFVAAAGNSGNNQYSYPASYDSVVSVAAVDSRKLRAPFSQYNDQVGISAPGVGVRSCVPGGYDTYDGTSMAAPHVAGSAALLYELKQDPQRAQEALLEAAEELGAPEEYGAGLVRPDQAIGLEVTRRRAQ